MKIEELVIKSISQKLSLEEERQLYLWIHESESNKNEYIKIQKLYTLLSCEHNYNPEQELRVLNEIKHKIKQEKRFSLSKKVIISTLVASALLTVSFLIYDTTRSEEPSLSEFKFISLNNEPLRDTIIESGSPKAYLTTTAGVITISNKDVLAVKKEISGDTSLSKLIYNTITVPEKGQFHIILDDSTKVLLNGGSSLTYPVTFTGNERSVLLSGEAYFDVKTDSLKPFIVMAKMTKSVVYGTKINVCAYPKSKYVSTTLFSGKVKVNNIELKPGERAMKNNLSEAIVVNEVDLDMISSWTRGVFYFNNTNLETIMEQLSQWYGIKVNYENQIVKEEKFTLVFKRDETLHYAIKLLSNTKKVKLKLNEDELYVEEN